MKYGIRKPSIKKRIKAKTTGKINRSIKNTLDPIYNKKGSGYIKNPKKAIYNNIYSKTTVNAFNTKSNLKHNNKTNNEIYNSNSYKDIIVTIPKDNIDNNIQNKNKYQIINENTVKIQNKTFTKQQIQNYRNLFLILGITFILLGILIFPILLLGLLCIFMYNYYNKIYKELK